MVETENALQQADRIVYRRFGDKQGCGRQSDDLAAQAIYRGVAEVTAFIESTQSEIVEC